MSRFAGRAQAAEDALGTAKKAAISLVSLSGPRFERPTRSVYRTERSGIKLTHPPTPDARKSRYSLSLFFNLTQARAADDELWCVYDPVFDLFLPCEPAA